MYKHVITALAATVTGLTLMTAPAAADDYDDRLREWCADAAYRPHSPLRDVISDDALVQYLTDDEYGRDGVRISYDRPPTAEEWGEINGYVHALLGQALDRNADATDQRQVQGTVNVNGHVRGLITAPWCAEYNRRFGYRPHWADSYDRPHWAHSYGPFYSQSYSPWTGPWSRPRSSASETAPLTSSSTSSPTLLDNLGVTGLLNSLGLSR